MPGSIDGLQTYLVLFLAGALATEVWRWLGLAVGGRIDVGGGLFQWVRAVATALVAGMVARMVLFPVGALADVGLALLLTGGALCNDAVVEGEEPDASAQATAVGDPTETALVYASAQAGFRKDHLERQFTRMAEVPFK